MNPDNVRSADVLIDVGQDPRWSGGILHKNSSIPWGIVFARFEILLP